jgi:hypothetical protein
VPEDLHGLLDGVVWDEFLRAGHWDSLLLLIRWQSIIYWNDQSITDALPPIPRTGWSCRAEHVMKHGDLAYVDLSPPFGGYTIATTMRYNVEWQKLGGQVLVIVRRGCHDADR